MSAIGRPFIVTLIGVLTIIFGIIEIINGLIAMFSTGFWGGLWQIIVGIIYIALARGLMGGSGVVRLIVAIVTIGRPFFSSISRIAFRRLAPDVSNTYAALALLSSSLVGFALFA